ncbi:hypothetical protein HYFRA_00006342 [Hymenoscyphus fraxineus]|uniref:Mating-type switching protein swi10 n=1 Tax=Hymenoscyphus fraxineus TaxID=746836 RepID=A0A9N9PPD9_9HELO|nr:hypothetical protein HYFRA_00006342 [Hymenoscyphus fraxineus]
MSLLECLLGRSDQGPPIVFVDHQQNRKKLQKPRGIKEGKKDRRSLPRSNMFLPASHHHGMIVLPPQIGYPIDGLPSSHPAQSYSSDLLRRSSPYSQNSGRSNSSSISSPRGSLSSAGSYLSHPSKHSRFYCPAKEMAVHTPRRAKTPIRFVGQLETKKPTRIDPSRRFAQEYLDLLPPRPFTPCVEEEVVKPRPRSIRKIKCQQSLRDMVKEQQSQSQTPSCCDTLVGSESPESPSSPVRSTFPEVEKLQLVYKPPRSAPKLDEKEPIKIINELHDEIGLGICMSLLTNELTTALFKQHPSEKQDRASGLQILLMIEAYETLREHVRKEVQDADIAGEEVDSHVRNIEGILDRWLESLYSIYGSSTDRMICEVIKEEDEEWPLRRSEDSSDSGRTYVSC